MRQSSSENDSPKVVGVLAEFDGPETLVAAARAVRQAGYTSYEAYSPFPVHGLDAALGRRRTRLPWLVFGGGVAGGVGGLALQWWTNAIAYPYEISGKPLFSLPANIPIMFELIILLAALAAFGGCLAFSGLPQLFHPLFHAKKFGRVTTDAFFLSIDATDPKFDEAATGELLRSLGAVDSEMYHHPDTPRKLPGVIVAAVVVLATLALLPPALVAKVRFQTKKTPLVHPVLDMDDQPRYDPQEANPLFDDDRGMRPPVEGTIAADEPVDNPHLLEGRIDGQPAATFPLPVTMRRMQRGRERFDIYCSPCHGLAGDGDGMVSQRAFEREEPGWVRPLSVHNDSVREQPVGRIFQTITEGRRTMPSYASQISVQDRWAIVLYVRALQRSRKATIEDVRGEQDRELLRSHLQ